MRLEVMLIRMEDGSDAYEGDDGFGADGDCR